MDYQEFHGEFTDEERRQILALEQHIVFRELPTKEFVFASWYTTQFGSRFRDQAPGTYLNWQGREYTMMVARWCAEQFGSNAPFKYGRRWQYDTLGRFGFAEPSDAFAFKMRWG